MSLPRQLFGDERALVIVDWSWWIRRAWSIGGIDGTASIVIGWLAHLLSDPMPPSVVVATDAPERWTFRHRATADLEPTRRYKANREKPSEDMLKIEERLLAVVRAHRIPILRPDNPATRMDWEADDSAAAAVRRARAEGRAVALVSADKDWLPLVRTSDPTEPVVVRWQLETRTEPEKIDTEESVAAEWGVTPEQMTDLLAMLGDTSDNVPGVEGIGKKTAARILVTYGSLEAALEAAIKGEEPPDKKLARPLRLLREHADEVRFSKSLIQLWDEAPIEWDPPAQAVGDFDVRALERLYRGFGFTRLAESIPSFPKARW
jgi:DNA polymerase-1